MKKRRKKEMTKTLHSPNQQMKNQNKVDVVNQRKRRKKLKLFQWHVCYLTTSQVRKKSFRKNKTQTLSFISIISKIRIGMDHFRSYCRSIQRSSSTSLCFGLFQNVCNFDQFPISSFSWNRFVFCKIQNNKK